MGMDNVNMFSEMAMADTRGPDTYGEQGIGRGGLRAVRILAQ